MNCFITGTDTEVGKTYSTCLLVKALRRVGVRAVAYKPILCGPRDDAIQLQNAADEELSLDEINPVWLQMPAAPLLAAEVEGVTINPQTLVDGYQGLAERFECVIVEGAGGWFVPIRKDYLLADLARTLQLPVAVVVGNRLGALNHTLLTLAAVHQAELSCCGVVLNDIYAQPDPVRERNEDLLETLIGQSLWYRVRFDQAEIEPPVNKYR